jgi:hypothetical protein
MQYRRYGALAGRKKTTEFKFFFGNELPEYMDKECG